ncbi:protein kinase [Catellatospora sp. KI3]|uniref:protein kinase domain-containing protein n=1 Tax=Catellatospora sp. KI3 TaxID=3041620 RepID=UPI002482CBD7|nr:protein kinase [Catellatospora sp. KI3]MDI1462837.1 protein kinase [Catellatospora sp. KI3]
MSTPDGPRDDDDRPDGPAVAPYEPTELVVGRRLRHDQPPAYEPTELTPGRRPRHNPAIAYAPTDLIPSRQPQPAGFDETDDAWTVSRLPHALALRFPDARLLRSQPNQAQVFLVHDERTAARVLKVYRPDHQPDSAVAAALPRLHHPHVVQVYETGFADKRYYELLAYVPPLREPGTDPDSLTPAVTLADLLRPRKDGRLAADEVRHLVGQIAPALAAAHELSIVHRDVRPANLLVRVPHPLDLAITDFGISTAVPDGEMFSPDQAGSMLYCPPEFLSARIVTAANDWWALGMTVLETCLGGHPLARYDERVARKHITRLPIPVAVEDPDIALLCKGLLTFDYENRWGIDQVQAWLRGESPPVHAADSPSAPVVWPNPRIKPLPFLGTDHYDRGRLAAHMVNHWSSSATRLFESPAQAWPQFTEWLRQFDEEEPDQAAARRKELRRIKRSKEASTVRLLSVIALLDPLCESHYRLPGRPITATALPEIAQLAFRAGRLEGRQGWLEREVVAELYRYRLLPLLSTRRGGQDLTAIDDRWRSLAQDWMRVIVNLEPQHRGAASDLRGEDSGLVRSMLLWLTVDRLGAQSWLRKDLQARRDSVYPPEDRARTVRLPWFEQLADSPDPLEQLAASLLITCAKNAASDEWREQVARADAAEAAAKVASVYGLMREYSRLESAGWAVVGVTFSAVFWVAALVGAGLIGWADQRATILGWGMLAIVLLVVGATETAMAGIIGGPYCETYSLLRRMVASGAAAARPVQRRGGVIVLALLAAYAVLVVSAAWLPVMLPAVALIAHLTWTWRRFRRWQSERQRHLMAEEGSWSETTGWPDTADERLGTEPTTQPEGMDE